MASFSKSIQLILNTGNKNSPYMCLCFSEGTILLLKHKLEISELLEDPMIALVFSLDYVIGEPISQEERKVVI